MVGLFAEASGIAKMVTAVSCAKVSQLTVIIGGNFGNYGCNRRTCGYQSFEMNKLRWSMEEEKFKKSKVLRLALSATLQSRRHVLIYLVHRIFDMFTISALVLGCWDIGFNSWALDRHEISVTSSLDLWTCEILISNFEL
ncbi:uncharacterized protein OCT59_014611 [Rhizophagus irregularis]|uniref:uncharacterized protein n=1 Tax=Rhizophagus irregularis TaxID=588596 RepID=UPI00332292E5|nr:hypothetical protein OCT59_014611 [Rhizophagus irregularis]